MEVRSIWGLWEPSTPQAKALALSPESRVSDLWDVSAGFFQRFLFGRGACRVLRFFRDLNPDTSSMGSATFQVTLRLGSFVALSVTWLQAAPVAR